MAEFLLYPAIAMGAVIGIIEVFFVRQDEKGLGNWLSHGLHALPIAMILVFVSMNLQWAAELAGFSLESNFAVDLGLRILIGLVAAFKVKAASALVKGHHGVGESTVHAIIIGALVAGSPYIWVYLEPYAPAWVTNPI